MLKSSLFATLLTVVEGALAVAVLVTAEDIWLWCNESGGKLCLVDEA